jgi:hypothetical protein
MSSLGIACSGYCIERLVHRVEAVMTPQWLENSPDWFMRCGQVTFQKVIPRGTFRHAAGRTLGSMRCFVTVGAGFVGSDVMDRLLGDEQASRGAAKGESAWS